MRVRRVLDRNWKSPVIDKGAQEYSGDMFVRRGGVYVYACARVYVGSCAHVCARVRVGREDLSCRVERHLYTILFSMHR